MPSVDYVDGQRYSPLTGLVYVFNLIVGTGALTLPAAFGQAGWALGLSMIVVLAFVSYMTVTFVVESMSIANAVVVRTRRDKDTSGDEAQDYRPRRERERDPLIPPELGDRQADEIRDASLAAAFEINQRIEMGRMAAMFFSKTGLYLFYLCIAIYLYGDLAIYIAAVAKSLRDVLCTYTPFNNTADSFSHANSTIIPDSEGCWSADGQVDRFDAYRLFSVLFIVTLGPFAFCNVQKTKYLQVLTSLMRWAAFMIMIGMAGFRIIKGEGKGHPPTADIYALPNLFGVCIYSFMCHHSLPSLVTPISSKAKIYKLFVLDYSLITGFYLLLAFTGIYAFDNINDLYTLNFEPEKGSDTNFALIIVQYFLALFPVFTLSTNFPIIAITLRNNLRALFQLAEDDEDVDTEDETVEIRTPPTSKCLKIWSTYGFPFLAILPPFAVALFVEDVQMLVSVTGSFAGAGIQYVIPIFLVYHARRTCGGARNPYASPFKHVAWLWLVLLWSVTSIVFVTVNYFIKKPSSS